MKNGFPTVDPVKTGRNIKKIMQMEELGVKDVQAFLGLGSVQSIYQWFYGKSIPSLDNLFALSELFGLPVDYIIRGDRGGMNYYHRAACLEWYLTHYGHEGREMEGCKQELEPFML